MQNIEILVGSPRRNGNSIIMADMLRRKFKPQKFDSNITYLYNLAIKPCVDCRACKKGEKECVLKDDMIKVYERLKVSDTIIIATPIYWFGPTAQTKLMLDRLRPFYANKKLAGKKLALLLPAGTGEPDCDLTIEMFKRSAKALEMSYIGEVTAEAYDAGEVNNDTKAIASIIELSIVINSIG
jgi:multimeric flavodoxin WrbA